MQAQKYKEPTFENVEVGETFGPVTLKTDDFFLKSYAYATDDYSAVEIVDGQVRATGFVPGAAIVSELMLVFLTVYDPDGVVGLHQKEEAEYFAPVPVGTTLTLTGRYIDKYERRGKGYCVLEAEARDESGRLVVRQRSTEIMRIPEGISVGTGSGEPDRRITPVPLDDARQSRITAETPVGTSLVPLVKHVRQAQMSVFSGAEIHKQGIHTVRSIAQKAGLKDCLAQGMMESCWASEYLTRLFGEAFLANGRHFTTYLSPVYAHDAITIEGRVSERTAEENGQRVEVEYWLKNQDGVVTAVGFGSARI